MLLRKSNEIHFYSFYKRFRFLCIQTIIGFMPKHARLVNRDPILAMRRGRDRIERSDRSSFRQFASLQEGRPSSNLTSTHISTIFELNHPQSEYLNHHDFCSFSPYFCVLLPLLVHHRSELWTIPVLPLVGSSRSRS